MNNILVLGGTGFLGRSLCEQLLRLHEGGAGRVVVPTRHMAHARPLWAMPSVEVVEADVHDDRTLELLVHGRDAVVNLIAILHGSAAEFERVHVGLPRRLARACLAAGVRRVVHVSALGAQAGGPSNYLRTKAEGEKLLASLPLDLTILRPSVMFGLEDHFLNTFARLQRWAPVMPLAGAQAQMQPVWVEDVATAIVRSLEHLDTRGRTYECAGPRVMTLREIVRSAGRWSGHPRPILPLPDSLARLQATVLEHWPGPTLMSRDNLLSLQVPNVATGRLPGLYELGIAPTPIESVGPAMLGPTGGTLRLQRWRAAARRH